MKNPIIKKLLVLGTRKNDEIEYFDNPDDFEEDFVNFPLNTIGDKNGVFWNRLENFLRLHYLHQGKKVQGTNIYYIYNYQNQQFEELSELIIEQSFIVLNENYFDSQQRFIIKVKVQLLYKEYREIKTFLEDITSYIHKKKDNNQKLTQEIIKRGEIIHQLKNEIMTLKKIYPTQQHQKVDMVWLYSHPIISHVNDNRLCEPVSYQQEIITIKNNLENQNKKIHCLITQATKKNLQLALKYDPKILHIMSHGDVNEQKGYYLQFEAQCCDDPIYTKELESIIDHYSKNLQLVILSSCHSGEIAKMISQYAPTIAVDAKLKMLNEAGIQYSAALYEQLVQNNELQQCHEKAKAITKEKLQAQNSQCCCSHGHVGCLYNKGLKCYFHDVICECKNSQELLHEWNSVNKCDSIREKILSKLNITQKNKIDNLLEKIVNNGEIRVCCCELSQLITKQQITQEFEHKESEKFQIFGSNHKLNLEFDSEGKLIEINKFPIKQLNFVGWKKDAAKLFFEIKNQEQEKKPIVINITHVLLENIITEYTTEVCNYYIQRKLTFYEISEIDCIQIKTIQFIEIEEALQRKCKEDKVKQIWIINNVKLEDFLTKQDIFWQIVQKNLCVILICTEEITQSLDNNKFQIVVLKDWNVEDSEKIIKQQLQDDKLSKQIIQNEKKRLSDIIETFKIVEAFKQQKV